jgi:hypothetical protein
MVNIFMTPQVNLPLQDCEKTYTVSLHVSDIKAIFFTIS